jgi:hypothetical protein
MAGRIVLIEDALTGYRRHASNQSSSNLVSLKWHETVEECIRLRADRIAPDVQDEIRTVWLERLASLAWNAKYARDWNDYWAIRRHLNRFPKSRASEAVLNNRIYPRWLYAIQDRLTGIFTARQSSHQT